MARSLLGHFVVKSSTLSLKGLSAGAFALAACLCALPAVAADAPDVRLKEITDQLLTNMRSREAEFRGDDARLFAFVDETLTPFLDEERIVRIILGKQHYMQASTDQREAFLQSIRRQLIRLYSKTILAYVHGEVRYLPFESKPGKSYQVVRTEFLLPSREPVDLTYLMREVDGSWRVFEVRAAGIFLLKSLQKSLRPEIDQNGLEAVIKRLRESSPDASARYPHWLNS